ncbi:unnamed protein product [Urochloa humidicola]
MFGFAVYQRSSISLDRRCLAGDTAVTITMTATTTNRYRVWEQSELEKHMFLWSIKDMLNENLLKKKAKKTPKTFTSH